ncbi:MAG: hypothetical protein K0U72_01360 [Gammaproteobacteria bacterium]|nr:hypothetical protein [Gammaproteobacteria bacterium]
MNEARARHWVVDLFQKHPALLVSAFYVAASVIGMFYSWAFLRHFDVNVFNYAQISDFLLASLKEPLTWALVFVSVVLVLLDNASSRKAGRKDLRRWLAWYGSPRYRMVNNFTALFMVLVFIYSYATAQARDVKAGEGKTVNVEFSDGEASVRSTLLGTTGQWVFLYEPDLRAVDIHPVESIHSISFQAD